VRDAGHTTYGVGKISDIFAGCDIDESFPTKSNVDGINRTIELLENIDDALAAAFDPPPGAHESDRRAAA